MNRAYRGKAESSILRHSNVKALIGGTLAEQSWKRKCSNFDETCMVLWVGRLDCQDIYSVKERCPGDSTGGWLTRQR